MGIFIDCDYDSLYVVRNPCTDIYIDMRLEKEVWTELDEWIDPYVGYESLKQFAILLLQNTDKE